MVHAASTRYRVQNWCNGKWLGLVRLKGRKGAARRTQLGGRVAPCDGPPLSQQPCWKPGAWRRPAPVAAPTTVVGAMALDRQRPGLDGEEQVARRVAFVHVGDTERAVLELVHVVECQVLEFDSSGGWRAEAEHRLQQQHPGGEPRSPGPGPPRGHHLQH